jgi:hypothetical protein
MFCFRALEKPGVVTQTIPIGGQIRVSPTGGSQDLSAPEIDNIINQHRVYGITSADNLNDNSSPFNGLIYSIGKPISEEKLRRAMQKNEDLLRALGKRMQQEAALAVNSQIEERIGAPLRNLEMSFQELEPRGGYAEDLDHVAEGVRVTREAVIPAQGRRNRA